MGLAIASIGLVIASIVAFTIAFFVNANWTRKDYNDKFKKMIDGINEANYYEFEFDKVQSERIDDLRVKDEQNSAQLKSESLDIGGNLMADKDSTTTGDLKFSKQYSGFPELSPKNAEIANDSDGYKKLVIAGNRSSGKRTVGVLDRLDVHGDAVSTDWISGRNAHARDHVVAGDWKAYMRNDGSVHASEVIAGAASMKSDGSAKFAGAVSIGTGIEPRDVKNLGWTASVQSDAKKPQILLSHRDGHGLQVNTRNRDASKNALHLQNGVESTLQVKNDGRISATGPVQITRANPGPMLERNYGSDGNRYGVGQWPNGATRVYAAADHAPASVNLSMAKKNNSFEDIVKVTSSNVQISKRISVAAADPGSMIERNYGSDDNRYGFGQWPNGTTRVYAAARYAPASINLSMAKANNTFDDIVKVTKDSVNITKPVGVSGNVRASSFSLQNAAFTTNGNDVFVNTNGPNNIHLRPNGQNAIGETIFSPNEVIVNNDLTIKKDINVDGSVCTNNVCINSSDLTNIKKAISNLGANQQSQDMTVAGRLRFDESTNHKSDSYYLEKKIAGQDASSLRMTINDNPNEVFEIWGDSCATTGCAKEGVRRHSFQATGNAMHEGALLAGAQNQIATANPWNFNYGVHSRNTDGRWTHFPWKDGKNYVRGDTRLDGKLELGGKWTMSPIGDAHANDEWLRLFGTADNQKQNDYYGGFAAGKMWTKNSWVTENMCMGSTCITPDEFARLKQLANDVVQSGMVHAELNCKDPNGPKQIEQKVAFEKPFTKPPKVQLSTRHIDWCNNTKNLRISTYAKDVTTKGFTAVIETWSDTSVWSIGAIWIAHPSL